MKTIVMPSFAGGSSHAYFGSALRESRADGVAVAEGTCAWQALRGLGVGTRAEGKGGGASRILVNSGMLSYGMHAHLDHFLCWRCRCGRYVFATKLATERQKKVLIAPELEQAEGMFVIAVPVSGASPPDTTPWRGDVKGLVTGYPPVFIFPDRCTDVKKKNSIQNRRRRTSKLEATKLATERQL